MWVEFTSGCHSDDVPGQQQRVAQSKTRRHAEPVDTRGVQVKKVRHEESGCERERHRLDDEATTRTENLADDENHWRLIRGAAYLGREGSHCTWLMNSQQRAEWKFDRGVFAVDYGA